MPTSLPNQATEGERARTVSYAYKASLISSAQQFELTDAGLSWRIGSRSGVWPYAEIASIRLSYRPMTMQSRRFRADIARTGGGRIAILSTSWQTVALMTPQDQGYRAFITELHRRMKAAGSTASLNGGIGTVTYAVAVAMLALLAIAMVGLLVRALATSEFIGALFLVGMAIWFAWTVGGFIKRNRPRRYSFDALPETLLP
ncbi:hypothetical protein ACH79_41760 [Bradyrhizobium sp. CCBAU 051011]|uniref:hypothetical protein n=1 Tax=Bradyrhizobium sp. CCBAU 051011 TaxID=858422 RepID=UPI001373DF26|nr:hypothetical protein [Bradyrhizobium sp. CCBAU 051011]QHO78145.1 hypothetical protein ACH79_41760 [Bradyrhizobium sp. CCBAU 051011]